MKRDIDKDVDDIDIVNMRLNTGLNCEGPLTPIFFNTNTTGLQDPWLVESMEAEQQI